MYVRLIYTIMLAATLFTAVFLIIYAWKRRTIPGAKYFILMLITAIVYNGAYIGELNSSVFSSALFWFNIEHTVIPLQHYMWLLLSLEYVHAKKRNIIIFKHIMLYHPLLFYIVYYTKSLNHLYISSYHFVSNGFFPVIVTTKGMMYLEVVISGTIIGLLSTGLYIRECIRTPRLHRHRYFVMIIASMLPWSAVYPIATNTNYLGIDYYPIATMFSGILFMYGIFRYRIFNTFPIATEMVFRQSKDGILLLDYTDQIIDANTASIHLYPELGSLKKQSSLTAFVQKHPELHDLVNGNDRFDFHYTYDRKNRYYSVEVSRIMEEDRLELGKMITISDVTQIYDKQYKLEAIAMTAMDKAETNEISFLQAQINPHFINNTLSAIASMITRAPEEAKDLIVDLSEYLTGCYYFDSESAVILLEHELETVETYVNIEKARFRERLNFEIISDRIPNQYIPRLILQPLIENAIRHGILKKIKGGLVQLKIQNRKNGTFFEIIDNGAGMPEELVQSLLTEKSDIKGIGIRNIHKRLLKYYGEGLFIKSAEGQGTSVSFFIPDQARTQPGGLKS